MLFSAFPVSAALTEGNRYSFEEKHLNAYYTTGEWYSADGKMHDNYGQVTLRWLKDTGEPLYCIQIHNGVDASSSTAIDIESGTFKVNTELPEGKYYLKEIATDEHYIISSEQYDFEVKYTNQDETTVNIVINEGKEITNDLKRGSVKGVKVDNNS